MNVKYSLKKGPVPIFAFASVFLFLLLHNLIIPAMRSLPDEMGAIALAADFAGYDWEYVLTHPTLYYGFGGTLLFLPFFLLIKNPTILYQCLLGCGALMRAIPAYLVAKILYNQKGLFVNVKIKQKNIIIYFCAIICALLTGTRSSNIDNEALLILCGWVVFYLLVFLTFGGDDKHRRIICSILLAFALCFAMTVHTRALLYTLCALLTIVFSSWILKRIIIHTPAFLLTFTPLAAISQGTIRWVQKNLYNAGKTEAVLQNSTAELGKNIQGGISQLFQEYGVQSFVDLLSGNIWVLFVISGGLLLVAFCFLGICCLKVSLRRLQKKDVTFQSKWTCVALFPFTGVLFSLGGVCINWLWAAISVHEGTATVSRGHFYPRYLGNYFGPLLFVFFVLLLIAIAKRREHELSIAFMLSGVLSTICYLYGMASFVTPAVFNFPEQCADWFYWFAPFSPSGVSWPNLKTSNLYFSTSTLVVFAIFVVVAILFFRHKIVGALFVVLLSTIYQYTYSTVFFDKAFSESENYYGAINATYLLRKENPEIFEGVEYIYYYSPVYGPQYNVQFFLPDIQIIVETEAFEIESNQTDVIILSQTDDLPLINAPNGMEKYVLDDNEILYLNDAMRIQMMRTLK